MGFRFYRRVKIAPGITLNFGKKSVGVSFGCKGAHYTVNSSGRRTSTIGIPGTGLYYTDIKTSPKKKKYTDVNQKNMISAGCNTDNSYMNCQESRLDKISKEFYALSDLIQNDWSVLYQLKDYTGDLAKKIEKECLEGIELFKRILNEDYETYSEVNSVPAFTRLAMLYERQKNFEKSVDVCKQAISLGLEERSRMLRMIKKAGRQPTEEEIKLSTDTPVYTPCTASENKITVSDKKTTVNSSDNLSGSSSENSYIRIDKTIKWYKRTGWIVLLLIFFWPAGVYLMWRYSKWNKLIKIIITLFLIFMTYLLL